MELEHDGMEQQNWKISTKYGARAFEHGNVKTATTGRRTNKNRWPAKKGKQLQEVECSETLHDYLTVIHSCFIDCYSKSESIFLFFFLSLSSGSIWLVIYAKCQLVKHQMKFMLNQNMLVQYKYTI